MSIAWGAASDTGVLSEVLLARPVHYRWIPTNAVVRATLDAGSAADATAAAAQHAELEDALAGAGVRLRHVVPEEHLPYQVYTRDAVQMTHRGAVLTQLARPERRGEYAAVLRVLEEHAVPVWQMASAGTLEGGDIHLIRPGLAAIGVSGGRTDEAGAAQLARWLSHEGWEVRTVRFPEHFLHLDLLFAMAAEGVAVACTDVLEDGFIAWLGDHGVRLISSTYREAMALAGNVLALGDGRVLSARGSVRINAALKAEGLVVLDPELSVFTAGGGGPRCLTAPLRRDG
ncbi:dimethylarginine dimethylaminohydrolase family protein [Elioraea sp.]|uniref:dimethylarginine dimethylaminohydrolase family protein n=1 Tax=Elioraea sp. TaxID=2185103 RepID=UPI0025C3FAC3|nr:arginine deiminase family protein [Elioraea sp.]